MKPPAAASMTRDAVPMPPLNSWQIIPVPPPTVPSSTGPPAAAASAACRCSARTWKPLMSLSNPSNVSPTTGSDQDASSPSIDAATSGVPHDPDAVRVGDRDRRRQHPRFADPLEAGQLAVAVQPVSAREHGLTPARAPRADDRDAGPHRALRRRPTAHRRGSASCDRRSPPRRR